MTVISGRRFSLLNFSPTSCSLLCCSLWRKTLLSFCLQDSSEMSSLDWLPLDWFLPAKNIEADRYRRLLPYRDDGAVYGPNILGDWHTYKMLLCHSLLMINKSGICLSKLKLFKTSNIFIFLSLYFVVGYFEINKAGRVIISTTKKHWKIVEKNAARFHIFVFRNTGSCVVCGNLGFVKIEEC